MKPHRCKFPITSTYRAGSVFACDCGRTYVLSVSWTERAHFQKPTHCEVCVTRARRKLEGPCYACTVDQARMVTTKTSASTSSETAGAFREVEVKP